MPFSLRWLLLVLLLLLHGLVSLTLLPLLWYSPNCFECSGLIPIKSQIWASREIWNSALHAFPCTKLVWAVRGVGTTSWLLPVGQPLTNVPGCCEPPPLLWEPGATMHCKIHSKSGGFNTLVINLWVFLELRLCFCFPLLSAINTSPLVQHKRNMAKVLQPAKEAK